MADISAFPWLESWAKANNAVQKVQDFLDQYPSSWIRQDKTSTSWQNAGTAAKQPVKVPMPADTCEWEWTAGGWQQIPSPTSDTCPDGQSCAPRSNATPMPIGLRVIVPCHN